MQQTEQSRPTVFRTCSDSCNDGWERRRERWQDVTATMEFYFDATFCFFLNFVFSMEGNNFNMNGILYYITRLCLRLFKVHLLYDHFCAGRENFLKAIAVGLGLLRCLQAINNDGAAMKWHHA